MDMDAEVGLRVLSKAIEKQEIDKLYQLYVSIFPHMDPEKVVSFEELKSQVFKDMKGGATAPSKSKEEIMMDVERIMNNINGGEFY